MNPFLDLRFDLIKPEQLTPALEQLLSENKKQLEHALKQDMFTWENVVEPLEQMEEKLDILWSVVSQLHAVKLNEWREVYQANLPKLIEYQTAVSQNEALYHAYSQIRCGHEYKNYSPSQKKLIENTLRDFKLSGVHLPPQEKKKYAELQQQLGKLTTQFEENIVDATHAWQYYTEDESLLSGLPLFIIKTAKEQAAQKGKSGWELTLDFPCYLAVMTHAAQRSLRETFYHAYVTRASDQGPFANQWDNGPLMNEILKHRQELAELLHFKNFAELSLQTKMLKHAEEVTHFLDDIVEVALPRAKQEWDQLLAYAKNEIDTLHAWDVLYYREKYQQEKFHLNNEELRAYFPIDKVIKGLFEIVSKLYQVSFQEETVPVWHSCVKYFSVYDHKNKKIGGFYFDLYARPEKREGAWMAEAKSKIQTTHFQQLPMAYLNCNFDPPCEGKSYLTHEQVITLFHEFGHGLQHVLTAISYPSVGGIAGVPWDVVEVPSQLLENWCWEKEALHFISENLPEELFERMRAARHFCAALDLMRQVEFSLFDFQLHLTYDKHHPVNVIAFLNALKEKLSVIPTPAYNRFPNGFSHIFAGAYAAAYYSYLWAEILSSDIFSLFKKEGLFNSLVAQRYLQLILSQGAVCDPLASFISFMGREPTVDAFLEQRGIIPKFL